MKRCFLAVAILLGPVVGLVCGDYVLIMIDLSKQDQGKQKGGGHNKGGPMGPDGGPMGPLGPGGPMGGPIGPGGPMGGMKGGMGFAGFGGYQGGFQGGTEELPPSLAYAVVESKNPPVRDNRFPNTLFIEHAWGKTSIPAGLVGPTIPIQSASKQFAADRAKVIKPGKKLDPGSLVDLAEKALRYGLPDKFVEVMNKLVEVDPQDKVAKAFTAVRGQMKNRPTQDDPSATWLVDKLLQASYKAEVSSQGHYKLLTNSTDTTEIKGRLARLERTYEGFYYWYVLKGTALPVAKQRLVAVLEADPKKFRELQDDTYKVPDRVADSFTPRRDNVAIFSARRLDETYALLDKINQNNWKTHGWTRDELLSGGGFKKDPQVNMILPQQQTYALVQKAMEAENESASASHEGIRQLLSASGLLPRNVLAPEWLEFGMASFFETPRMGGVQPYPALWQGVGMPNWKYYAGFKAQSKEEKLGDPKTALLKVITDSSFRKAHDALRQARAHKEEQEQPALVAKAEKELETARTTAWALTYYLARKDMRKLDNYFQALNELPRDLELNDKVLQRCFFQAFGLTDAKDPSKVNETALTNFANDWFSTLEATVFPVPQYMEAVYFHQKELKKAKEGPAKGPPNTPPGSPIP